MLPTIKFELYNSTSGQLQNSLDEITEEMALNPFLTINDETVLERVEALKAELSNRTLAATYKYATIGIDCDSICDGIDANNAYIEIFLYNALKTGRDDVEYARFIASFDKRSTDKYFEGSYARVILPVQFKDLIGMSTEANTMNHLKALLEKKGVLGEAHCRILFDTLEAIKVASGSTEYVHIERKALIHAMTDILHVAMNT